MENQHRKIAGYRELDESDIALINEIKSLGAQTEQLIARVRLRASAQASTPEGALRHQVAESQRWAAEARTDLQKGLMALTRAVAQPTNF